MYAWDKANQRVLVLDKTDRDGKVIAQYRLPAGNDGWADVRSMYVVGSGDETPTIVWMDRSSIHFSLLEPVSDGPSPSPGGSAPASDPSGSPGPAGASSSPSAAP
jgi:hypothetical protein